MLPKFQLAEAIQYDHVDDLKEALSRGANVNECIDGQSMLQLAEKHNANRCVPLLVKNGADVLIRDSRGDGLLHRAARRGNYGFVVTLLEHGPPNLAQYVNERNIQGQTALHLAAKTGQVYLASLFIGKGANVNLRDRHGRSPRDLAESSQLQSMVDLLKLYGAAPNPNTPLFSYAERLEQEESQPRRMFGIGR